MAVGWGPLAAGPPPIVEPAQWLIRHCQLGLGERHKLPQRGPERSPGGKIIAYISRGVVRILQRGGAEAERRSIGFSLRVCIFSQKSWPFLVVVLKTWAPQRGPYFWQAHRTLLVERTVLLYWIKQALHPNRPVFFGKKSTQSTIGRGRMVPLWLRPWLYVNVTTLFLRMINTLKASLKWHTAQIYKLTVYSQLSQGWVHTVNVQHCCRVHSIHGVQTSLSHGKDKMACFCWAVAVLISLSGH